MPLLPGKANIGANISELTHHGNIPRSHDQIVAIAMANARRHPRAYGGTVAADDDAPTLGFPPRRMLDSSMPAPFQTPPGGWGESKPLTPEEEDILRRLEKRPAPEPSPFRANGGSADIANALRIAKRDAGGFVPPIMPGFERAEERSLGSAKPYGFTAGTGAGRLDKNDVSVASGSYVLPADVVAGLGDGNSLAGAHVWNAILGSMPYGVNPPKSAGHRGPPPPPHNPEMMAGITGEQKTHLAAGGGVDEVPIRSADGEIIVHPDDVMRVGHFYAPDRERANQKAVMRRGHKVLDGFVRHVRGQTIRHLKKLKGPVGSADPKKGHT